MKFLIMAEANSEAYQMGQVIGFLIVFVPLLLGVMKCLSLLRRPTTSRLCVISLMLVLLGWLLASFGQGLCRIFPDFEVVLQVVFSMLAILFMLAGVIVAITGLACYDKSKHVQGRAQAGWAIAISGIFMTIALVIAVNGIVERQMADGRLVADSNSGIEKSEEHNIVIARPQNWVTVKPSTLNPLACLAFRRSRPEAYAIVIAEQVDGEISNEQFMEAVKSNMAASSTSVKEDKIEAVHLNGLDFLRRTCVVNTAAAPLIPFYFEQWTTVCPGHAWQVACWGVVGVKDQIIKDTRTMMEGFKLLEPGRVFATSARIENVDRPSWGYRTQLSTSDWGVWQDHGQALADFAALRPLEAVIIMPVDLGEQAPDVEAVASALLARLEIPYPSDEGWTGKPWRSGWGEGLEITGSRIADGTEYSYILRVAVKDHFAQMHAGWAEKKAGDLSKVRTALDSITLLPPKPPLPVLPPAKLQDYGYVCNDVGIALYNENQFKPSVPWFRRAFEQTGKDAVLLGNLADAMRQAGEVKPALEYLKPRIGAFPKHPTLHLHHAWLLSDAGDDSAANAAFLQAVEAGLKDENKALEWFQHLNGMEKYGLALKAAEAWMARSPGVNSRRWHAQTVIASGDSARGLELLEKLSAEYPEDRRVLYDLGEALNDEGEHARASTVADKILADGKDTTRALMILGWSQMGRKWYREAKLTFEKADKKQPDNETIQDALRRASAMLGQGNNSDIKTPVEAVALPEVVLKAMAANPAEKDYGSDQPYAWMLTAKGYHFEQDKPLRHTWHRRARIHTTEGANDLSSIDYAFDPLSERIFINHVKVTDENGKVIAEAPGDAYVMDLDNGNASHRKKLHFQVPGLRPGCIVEYSISVQDLSKTATFPFERHLFGDSAADIVFVEGEPDKVKIDAARIGGLQAVREKNLAAWMGFNMPFDRSEPMSGLYEDRVPGVTLCGDEGSWSKIGEEYLDDIEERLKPDADAVELAARLTEGIKTDRDKITALAGHVQKQISYTAIEFGTRARRPNAASQTIRQQYGDCKDQALLMHQLLNAAGIESHLALVDSSWRIHPSLPSMDQFNHMVVHVPILGDGWLIDTTDKNLPPALWHADGLWHSHALILQPGKVRLIPPRSEPAKESSLVESRRMLRVEDDAWHIEETLTLHGYYASWMRGAFTGLDSAAQLRKAQGLLEKNGRVRVHDFTFENLADISTPAKLVITYDVPGRMHEEAGFMRGTLPALWENEYLSTTFVKDRQTGFLFRYPFRFRSEVRIMSLSDVTPDSMKAFNDSADGSFSRWKLAGALEKQEIVLRFEFDTETGEYPAASYARWHDEWNAALKAWERPFVCKP